MHRLYSIEEAAKLCRMSESWFYKYVAIGRIPAARFGRSIRISEDVLERLQQGEFDIPERVPAGATRSS